MPKRFIRVLILDDQPAFQEGVLAYVKSQPSLEMRGETVTSDAAARELRTRRPDVCLVEVDDEVADAVALVKRLRRASARTRVVLLVSDLTGALARKVIEAGAAGVILKDRVISEFLEAVGQGARSQQRLRRRRRSASLGPITNREAEVLGLLAVGHTVREVAELLELSHKTVDAHKTNLMRKLGLHSRLELYRYAVNLGLLRS